MLRIKQKIAAYRALPIRPGDRVQIGVKIVPFKGSDYRFLRRYQFTAIDVATRLRFLRIYPNLTSANAARFLKKAKTFFSKLGITVVCVHTGNLFIFRNSPFSKQCRNLGIMLLMCQLTGPNDLAEKSHGIDDVEFYRLLDLGRLDDKAVLAKLQVWQYRFNCLRQNSDCNHETPFNHYLNLREALG